MDYFDKFMDNIEIYLFVAGFIGGFIAGVTI